MCSNHFLIINKQSKKQSSKIFNPCSAVQSSFTAIGSRPKPRTLASQNLDSWENISKTIADHVLKTCPKNLNLTCSQILWIVLANCRGVWGRSSLPLIIKNLRSNFDWGRLTNVRGQRPICIAVFSFQFLFFFFEKLFTGVIPFLITFFNNFFRYIYSRVKPDFFTVFWGSKPDFFTV